MNPSEQALKIATEVENLGSKIYPQIQPEVIKILKDEYSIYTKRTPNNEWRVRVSKPSEDQELRICYDKPETEYDIMKKKFNTSNDPNLILRAKKPKTRRKFKDDGYLVDGCFVSKGHLDIENLISKGSGSSYVKERPSKKVLKFYKNRGYKIGIKLDERFPCGCRDMYDLYSCNVNHKRGRIEGYWLNIAENKM